MLVNHKELTHFPIVTMETPEVVSLQVVGLSLKARTHTIIKEE